MERMKNKIWFHADDYGVTRGQSERILGCYRDGVLNSISVIPNSDAIRESLALLDEADPGAGRIRRVLHLNFVEGRPLAGADNVPLLVDGAGYFDKSFVRLFKWGLTKKGGGRGRLKAQLKLEIAAQLRAVTAENNYRITAVDSHQHYHMIPLVFDSLMEVLSDKEFEHVKISHIRIPADPLLPLMHNLRLFLKAPKINWAKWCILRLYAGRNKRRLAKRGIGAPVFFGIFYTCEMTKKVAGALFAPYKAYAFRRGEELELMFHPGGLLSESELLPPGSRELADFYLSDNRRREAECLKYMKNIV